MPGYQVAFTLSWRKDESIRMGLLLKSPSDGLVAGRGTVWGAGRLKTFVSSSLAFSPARPWDS